MPSGIEPVSRGVWAVYGYMDYSKLSQTQLAPDTKIKPFKCAEDDLNGFLFDDAKHFQEELMAVTYLIEDNEKDMTVVFLSSLQFPDIFNIIDVVLI